MSRKIKVALVASALLFACSASATAMCGSGLAMTAESETNYEVSMDAGGEKISTGEPLSVDVAICSNDDVVVDRFKLDATMPAHGHGMNYVPEIKEQGKNQYTASGLFLHMPGKWRFEVSFSADGKTHRFFRDVDIE